MNILKRMYGWYGRRNVLIFLAVAVVLVIAGLFVHFFMSEKAVEQAAEEKLSQVIVSSVNSLGSQSAFRVTGTVRAVSEARLQTEASGRITNVSVGLGDAVRQGTIIASIENSAQRAALLQAEGAYDAARASAASSQVGTESAEDALDSALVGGINTYQSAYITVDSIIHNEIDDLFLINNDMAIGFRLDAKGEAPALNAERNELEKIINEWEADKNSATKDNIPSRLSKARQNTLRVALFVDRISEIVTDQERSNDLTDAERNAYEATLTAARGSLNQTLQAIEGASASIDAAEKGVEQAQIAGSSSIGSASSAQIKIALGSLRAAQASYEKTLVRTPIAGVVNALYVKAGEYANQGSPAAVIANNNALEITTALSADDADMIEIGETVAIDETVSGIVTAIAPAIDPISGKKEVKLSVSDDTELTNGSTVSVEFKRNAESTNEAEQDIIVPLSALKITASGPVAFTISAENTLTAHSVVLGEILGDMVVVNEGLTPDMQIVVDARGLKEGEKVEVTQ
jgi:multidrug efflux pump subunit AcrA (membrane-fusion protein)